jgi:hypothetical protein
MIKSAAASSTHVHNLAQVTQARHCCKQKASPLGLGQMSDTIITSHI